MKMGDEGNVNFISTAGTSSQDEKGHSKKENQEIPGLTFSTFVMSLSSSAELHFGEMNDPFTGKRNVNLPMAKQTVEIVSMLKEKTKGNLTPDEEALIDNVLYELRMKYAKSLKT
ncbi:MAG: DUF1844 domain-containing protein [Nitrospinota bacterium]